MPDSCAECDRLWQELGEAIRAYLKLVAERHAATPTQDLFEIEKIERSIDVAMANRDAIRKIIADHETTAHMPITKS